MASVPKKICTAGRETVRPVGVGVDCGKKSDPFFWKQVPGTPRWYSTHARNVGVTDTGFHAFRHTFASRALAAGVPITDVSEWCGHADPAITLALYSWALPGDKRETIGLLDAHLGGITA